MLCFNKEKELKHFKILLTVVGRQEEYLRFFTFENFNHSYFNFENWVDASYLIIKVDH